MGFFLQIVYVHDIFQNLIKRSSSRWANLIQVLNPGKVRKTKNQQENKGTKDSFNIKKNLCEDLEHLQNILKPFLFIIKNI